MTKIRVPIRTFESIFTRMIDRSENSTRGSPTGCVRIMIQRKKMFFLYTDMQVHEYSFYLILGSNNGRKKIFFRQSNLIIFHLSLTEHWICMNIHCYCRNSVFLLSSGGDDTLPISVLRDAYIRNGSYNVFLVDWGALCASPCYPAAVSNLRPVARCLAASLTTLRNLGLPISRTTCVGHSLGAHICGIMANFLLFRMHRIIGLDPARPLVRPGYVNRLDSGDADFVQVIHTNAGYYGEGGRMGHVDFCVNGGKVQPFCENKPNYQLCSHVWVVCYMAESIDNGGQNSMAEPCTRRCPSGPRIALRAGEYVTMGQHTPVGTRGSFCFTSKYPPYCPKYRNGRGDERCCVPEDKPATF